MVNLSWCRCLAGRYCLVITTISSSRCQDLNSCADPRQHLVSVSHHRLDSVDDPIGEDVAATPRKLRLLSLHLLTFRVSELTTGRACVFFGLWGDLAVELDFYFDIELKP
jgi:hypothetical protein